MSFTYTFIASNTLSTPTASVSFSGIPNSFTDLVIRMFTRNNGTQTPDVGVLNINNNSSANFAATYMRGTGTGVNSARDAAAASAYAFNSQWTGSTANTFASTEIYIPNYLASTAKPMGTYTVTEDNASAAFMALIVLASSATAPISTLTLSSAFGNSFIAGSSFYLYGIKNT